MTCQDSHLSLWTIVLYTEEEEEEYVYDYYVRFIIATTHEKHD